MHSSAALVVCILAVALLTGSLQINLSRVAICSLLPNPGYGDCRTDHEERFYFDVYELRCKKFLFLNCIGGNENRFITEAECTRFCSSTACDAGQSLAVSSSGTPLICEKPSVCPKGYKCVYDELFRRHHCCGYFNDSVCPVDFVSYASLATGSALHCTPSVYSDPCPEEFVCIGHGQNGYCCKPKDICPLGQSPDLSASSEHPVKCNLQAVNGTCSHGFECITPYSALWGFCCSSNITGWCPHDSRTFLDPDTGQPQKCTVQVTTCRVGYSCQSQNDSVVGFCCQDSSTTGYEPSGAKTRESRWSQNLQIAEGLTSAIEHSDNRQANDILPRSLFSDMMTILTCPDTLSPSYFADSQLIIECTETEQLKTACPAPAKCVTAPRDVLRRSVCCSAINTS